MIDAGEIDPQLEIFYLLLARCRWMNRVLSASLIREQAYDTREQEKEQGFHFIYFMGLTLFKYPPIILPARNTAISH